MLKLQKLFVQLHMAMKFVKSLWEAFDYAYMIQSRNKKLLLLVPATPERDKWHRQQTRKTNRFPFVLPTLTARPTAKEPGHPAGSHQVLALADPAIHLALVEKRAVAQILPSAGCGRSSEHARVNGMGPKSKLQNGLLYMRILLLVHMISYHIILHYIRTSYQFISKHSMAQWIV